MKCLFTIKVQTPDLTWHTGHLLRDLPNSPLDWDWVWGLWHSPLEVQQSGFDVMLCQFRVDFAPIRCGGELSDFHGDWNWTPFHPAGASEVQRG